MAGSALVSACAGQPGQSTAGAAMAVDCTEVVAEQLTLSTAAPVHKPLKQMRLRKTALKKRLAILAVVAIATFLMASWQTWQHADSRSASQSAMSDHNRLRTHTYMSPSGPVSRRLDESNATNIWPDCAPQAAQLSIVGSILGAAYEEGAEKCEGDCTRYCCTGVDLNGGVVLYFLVMLYSFLGLAIICDDYFCESLDAISEALSLSEDVAGATFMAAGSSAPELFTAIVTILVTESSEGLGTIVGSAIFNIMVIVGVTALYAGQRLRIWWFPLSRDSFVYFLSIAAMVIVVADKKVHWWEAALLVCGYGFYIFLMVINGKMTAKAQALEAWWDNRKKAKKAKGKQPKPIKEFEVGANAPSFEIPKKASTSTGGFDPAEISKVARSLARRSMTEAMGASPLLAAAASMRSTRDAGDSKAEEAKALVSETANAGDAEAAGKWATATASPGSNITRTLSGSGSSFHSGRVAPDPAAEGGSDMGNSSPGRHRLSPIVHGEQTSAAAQELLSRPGSSASLRHVAADMPAAGAGARVQRNIVAMGDEDAKAPGSEDEDEGDAVAPIEAAATDAATEAAAEAGSAKSLVVTEAKAEADDASKAAAGSSIGAALAGAAAAPSPAELASVSKLFGLGGSSRAKSYAPSAGAGSGAGAAGGLAAAMAKPAAQASSASAGPPAKKKSAHAMHAEYRKVWSGGKDSKKRRSNKRAAAQFRVQMKVAVATNRFKGALARARARAAAKRGEAPAGAGAGAGAAAAASAAPSGPFSTPAATPAAEAEGDDDEDSCSDKILAFFAWPLAMAMRFTVPNCGEERWKKWYFLTFTMSILWIGLLSFVMVDFAARAGCILKIPGLVMGLVVLAAGTSIPDALSSMLVAKLGQGDMAVANVLGSNVFNILLGLGLPWMVRALVIGGPVILPADEEIVQPVIVLLLYLIFFVAAFMINKWMLTKTVGVVFICAHVVFLIWNLLTLLDNPVIVL